MSFNAPDFARYVFDNDEPPITSIAAFSTSLTGSTQNRLELLRPFLICQPCALESSAHNRIIQHALIRIADHMQINRRRIGFLQIQPWRASDAVFGPNPGT